VIVSSNGGYNFWLGNYPKTKASTGNRDVPGRMQATKALRAAHQDEVELERAFYKEGLRFVREQPGRFITLSITKAANLWHLYPRPASVQLSKMQVIASALSYGLMLPFAFYWLFSRLRRSPGARLAFLLFLAFTLTHAVYISKVRFRLPLDALIVILAVGGISSLAAKFKWNFLENK
jgi:hypothetical protein